MTFFRLLFYPLFCLLLLSSEVYAAKPAAKPVKEKPVLSSINLIDREGLSQTISAPQKLKEFQKINFLSPQPYQKVMQVFKKGKNGVSTGLITSYHPNGQLKQYLEVVDNRANGLYREWFSNGTLHLEALLIGGIADLTPAAEKSWLFDRVARAWYESGALEAIIYYHKGELHGLSLYYHPNGAISKKAPYERGVLNGTLETFSEKGTPIQKISYKKGILQGEVLSYWHNQKLASKELYDQEKLQKGSYWKETGELIFSVEDGAGTRVVFLKEGAYQTEEIHSGVVDGLTTLYASNGVPQQSYHMKENKKEGEERFYYPLKKGEKNPQVKLLINWHQGKIQGTISTWYENGMLESEREFSDNKRNGLARAWYQDGSLMLLEEYSDNLLQKGDYQKKGESSSISKVRRGNGICTLFDSEGRQLRKINYADGKPLVQ